MGTLNPAQSSQHYARNCSTLLQGMYIYTDLESSSSHSGSAQLIWSLQYVVVARNTLHQMHI